MKKNNKGLIYRCIIGILILGIVVVLFLIFFNKEKKVHFVIKNAYQEIQIGEYKKIEYEVDDNVEIEWVSSDTNVIEVDSYGGIKGINYGIAQVTGKINNDKQEIIQSFVIKTYSGDKNKILNDILFPSGEIMMNVNSEFTIPYTLDPIDAYITSLKYEVDDTSIIEVKNNVIISKKVGITTLRIVVNDVYSKGILVNVKDNNTENKIIKKIESLTLTTTEINLKINEKSKISYTVKPIDAYIDSIRWESSDSSIVSVNNGEILAKKGGKAIVSLIINDEKKASVNVNVLVDVTAIKVDYFPKKLLRIGDISKISAHVEPNNATDKNIIYKSSNPQVVEVNNGVITGKSAGNATITLTTNNNKQITLNISVLPNKGLINGTGNLWGYHSLNEKIPVKAEQKFFQNLALNGKGILSEGIYTYNKDNVRYTYNISQSLLTVNSTKIMVRFYYPENTDLSSLNMFTFMGGDGEDNFNGYFDNIENDRSILQSSGIITLIAKGSKYNTKFDQYAANSVIEFAKIIFNRKDTSKNSIGGFSTGGTKVFWTADTYSMNRVVIFSSYFNWPSSMKNLKDKEILFYVPSNDSLIKQAKSTLMAMKESGYTNVTVISNDSEIVDKFSNVFLVINPGSSMLNGHLTKNVTLSGVFAYANE